MSNYIRENVLCCTPDGTITKLEAQSMQTIVNNCLEAINDKKMPGTAKCAQLLNVAKICLNNKYTHTAFELLHRVIKVGSIEIAVNNSYICLPYCYEAARQIDAIWKKFAPNERHISEYAKVKYDAMSYYDDYQYCYHCIDNEERFQRIRNFGIRHRIISD